MKTEAKQQEGTLTNIQFYIDREIERIQLIKETIEYKKGNRSLKEIKQKVKNFYQVQSPLLFITYLNIFIGVFFPIYRLLSAFFLIITIYDTVLIPFQKERKYLKELRTLDISYLEEELKLEEALLEIYCDCLTEAINKFE